MFNAVVKLDIYKTLNESYFPFNNTDYTSNGNPLSPLLAEVIKSREYTQTS